MAHEKEIRVNGNQDTIWNTLTSTLSYNGYKIKSTVPQNQIIAEKGSKLISGLVGGIKGGHRTVEIALKPTEKDILIKFVFKFSAWGAGIAYKGSIEEIDKMIQDFESECSKDQPVQHQPPQPSPSVQKPTCPKCNKEVSPDFSVCPYCSASLKTTNTCTNCNKELKPEFTVCPYCGTSR